MDMRVLAWCGHGVMRVCSGGDVERGQGEEVEIEAWRLVSHIAARNAGHAFQAASLVTLLHCLRLTEIL
jgi:hypothetical protein